MYIIQNLSFLFQGVTKVMQEVQLDKKVTLLDCPGLVMAGGNKTDASVALRNAIKVRLDFIYVYIDKKGLCISEILNTTKYCLIIDYKITNVISKHA